MRLIYTFHNEKHAHLLAAYFAKQKIESQVDITTNRNWGSDKYGDVEGRVWVIDEDQFQVAQQYLEEFLASPDDPEFTVNYKSPPPEAKAASLLPSRPNRRTSQATKIGPVTLSVLLICFSLFFLGIFTATRIQAIPSPYPAIPLISSPLTKALYYDYPAAYQVLDRVVRAWGVEALSKPDSLPEAAQILLSKFWQTPIWRGVYPMVVSHFQGAENAWKVEAVLFERVREGEVWRLFTPALLHLNLLHIFFNMLWLFVIGNQIEKRMSGPKYVFFILLAGVFTNTAQYLMGGPNFLGFSGVLCAMISFVWFRQKQAPWEGYQLAAPTVGFLLVFLFVMLGIQVWTFFAEVYGIEGARTFIANTAHFTGAFVGYLFSKVPTFSWRRKQ